MAEETIAQQLFEEPKTEPTEAAPVQEQAPVAPAPTPEPPKIEPGHVPLAAVLDEREKRKEAERQLAEYRAQQAAQTPPSVPADPEQLAAYVHQQTQRALTTERFDLSQTLAEEKHGADAVKAAMEWGMSRAQQSPAFAAEYVRQKHPIDWAVRQFKRDQLMSELGDDEATQKAFIEKRARELGLIAPPQPNAAPAAQAAAAPPQPVAAQPKPATPSLVHAQSAGAMSTPVAKESSIAKRLFGD